MKKTNIYYAELSHSDIRTINGGGVSEVTGVLLRFIGWCVKVDDHNMSETLMNCI